MKWEARSLVVLFVLTLSSSAQAEFDFEAYRAHLSQTWGLSGEQLIHSYEPFGPYEPAVPRREVAPYFFEEIDAKLGLTRDELALLQQHDFVVSQRWRHESYGDAFKWVWHADLPVFISTDAILHAVHRSYDQILEKVETEYLLPQLDTAIEKMHAAWPELERRHAGDPRVERCLADLDVYLTVARRLLEPRRDIQPWSDVESEVATILELIQSEEVVEIALFHPRTRVYDFSQFKLRGHYTSQEGRIREYFRCMMWIGRTEFRFTHPDRREDLSREITDAFLLAELARTSGAEPHLENIDRILRELVAAPDNLTLADLESLSASLGALPAPAFLESSRVSELVAELNRGPYAAQRTLSQVLTFDFQLDPSREGLPFSFLLMGQRFIPDSFITGQVVYPFTPCANPETLEPPCRVMPDPLDALFALGNDDVLPFLRTEMETHEYAWNLGALRYLMDSGDEATWGESLYTAWLEAIRTLSKTGRGDEVPQFMETGAWQQQKVNTQLAAWTELRHDNLLYAKPSYTGDLPTCSYPHGYVEPVPEFYSALATFARRASQAFASVPRLRDVESYFDNLEQTLDQLGRIATKELMGESFTEDEFRFLQSAAYDTHYYPADGDACSHGSTEHLGWYPDLIYASFVNGRSIEDDFAGTALEPDAVVADVHTDPNRRQVLHVATGDPELGIFVAALPGCDAIAYVGPVASYHQFVTSGFTRLSDEEWNHLYRSSRAPARPDWTNVYLADAGGRAVAGGPRLVTEPPLQVTDWVLPAPLGGDPGDPDDAPPDSTDAPSDSTGTPDDGGAPSDSTGTPDDDGAPSDSTGTPDDGGAPSDSTGTPPDDDGAPGDGQEGDGQEDDGADAPDSLTPFFGVSPNPARGDAIISFRLAQPHTGGVQISIFDSVGSRVRSFRMDGGPHLVHVKWDGNDSDGRKASAGVYYVALEAGSEVSTQKLVMIR